MTHGHQPKRASLHRTETTSRRRFGRTDAAAHLRREEKAREEKCSFHVVIGPPDDDQAQQSLCDIVVGLTQKREADLLSERQE